MKRCSNCGRIYQDDLNFCTFCGNRLEKEQQYDIFGEEMNNKENVEILDQYGNQINDTFPTQNKSHEILSLVSIACAFVPFLGLAEIIISIILNVKHFKKYRSGLGFLILSICMLIINITWTVLFIKFDVFGEIYGEISPSSPKGSSPKPTTVEI